MLKLLDSTNHLLTRVLSIPAGAFLLCLVIHFSKGREQFISFVQSWKLMTSFSFIIIIIHTALEIKTALEDYISNIKHRRIFIKLVLIGAGFMSLIICFSVGRA